MEDFTSEIQNENQNNCDKKYVNRIKPNNPFDNPTENVQYNDDYEKVVPQISIEGCEIPYIPSIAEKKSIRHYYNIAGGGILIQLALSVMLANVIYFMAMIALIIINGMSFSELLAGKLNKIPQYIQNSSISPGLTLISYLISNLLGFYIGCRLSKIEFKSLFKTHSLTARLILQYILIAVFIQSLSGIIVSFLNKIFGEADLIGNSDIVQYSGSKALILSLLYACIVAPLTEELFYRGFVMKTFSKVSQRFGIFASAFFFGIAHGNTTQFVLTFLLGIFMGCIDMKHNSLIPSICIHFTNNLTASAAGLIQNYCSIGSPLYVISCFIFVVLLLLGLVAFIFFCTNNSLPQSTIHQKYRCFHIFLSSPTSVVASVIYILIFITTLVN